MHMRVPHLLPQEHMCVMQLLSQGHMRHHSLSCLDWLNWSALWFSFFLPQWHSDWGWSYEYGFGFYLSPFPSLHIMVDKINHSCNSTSGRFQPKLSQHAPEILDHGVKFWTNEEGIFLLWLNFEKSEGMFLIFCHLVGLFPHF
jgi:hypothetical protein